MAVWIALTSPQATSVQWCDARVDLRLQNTPWRDQTGRWSVKQCRLIRTCKGKDMNGTFWDIRPSHSVGMHCEHHVMLVLGGKGREI